jgi:zinc protease
LYTAPEKDGFVKPESKQLLTALVVAEGDSLEAYDDGVSDGPLLSVSLKPGRIIDTIFHEAIDTREWKLSNGIRVVAKTTDFKNDEIFVTAFSPGGASLFSEEDAVSGSFATMILGQSGLGKFDSIQLGKKLAGKIASAGPSIGGSFENMRGSASPKDLETFFELVHMHFVEPRLDLKAFASVKTRMIASVENRLKSPNAVFADAVNEALYQGHPRHRPISVEMIEEIDPELALKLYEERFADASDFTFVFVGSLDLDALKGHVVKYLASLPNLDRTEEGRFNGDRKATGQLEVTIDQNLEEKTVARVMYHGDAEWSPENSYALGFAKDILNIRLRERLREQESKVYGASVSGSLSRWPIERFSTGFAFSSDPGNADGLIQSAREEIERLQAEGPLSEDLEKIRQQRIRRFEKGVKENRFWLGGLSRYLQEERPMETILLGPEVAKAFKGEEAQRAAQLYFDETNRLIAKLNPKSKE